MGAWTDEFVHYPRTPHLFNPELLEYLRKIHPGRDMDDKMLGEEETRAVLAQDDVKYVWESKIDGCNVGLSFKDGQLFLQNRGHQIGTGEHPQYSLFRSWAFTVLPWLQEMLGNRYIMYGEWTLAVHTIVYNKLTHFFHEFDIWDKQEKYFFDTELRQVMLAPFVAKKILVQVPVVHIGKLTLEDARKMVDHSPYYGEECPEGLYLKVEKDGRTIGRYKMVRPDFVQGIIEGEDHWSHKPMVLQKLAPGTDIFSIVT